MICLAGIMAFMGVLAGARLVGAGPFSKVKNLGESLVDTKDEWDRGADKVRYAIAKKRGKIYYKTITTNPVTGEWGTQATCEDQKSLTCRRGQDHFANCMHQIENYYYRLVAAHFEKKLADGKDLSDVQRKELEEDLASVKEAIDTGRVIDANPRDPKRWMFKISSKDREEINRLNSKYIQEVYKDCEERFGVMGRYK